MLYLNMSVVSRPWLYWLQTASDWQTFRLSDEQVRQYHKDGYISNVKILSDEQCDRLLADYSLFLVSIRGRSGCPGQGRG